MTRFPRYFVVIPVLLVLGLAGCSSVGDGGGEGPEGSAEGGVGHDSGGGEASEVGGDGGGEESAVQLDLTETFDTVRAGTRLILRYDASTMTFNGTVENTTGQTLTNVRVEIHLSNGAELGPLVIGDLPAGETRPVTLDATGQSFTTWSPHAEVGAGEANHASDRPMQGTFTPSLGGWAVMGGVPLGIENQSLGLSAAWTDATTWQLSPSGPQHQPTEAATWTGEWAGRVGSNSAIVSGDASVTVNLAGSPTADMSFKNVPGLGTLQWQNLSIMDGRFSGSNSAGQYNAVGQFGGAEQSGVAGVAWGSDLQSVFYGVKSETE